MKMPSNQQHTFSQVPKAEIPRSAFDRSHSYKTTFDSGYLIPFYVDEALPGDTFNLNTTIFTRLATPIVPFIDNLWMDTFYFAVPNRLVWEDFQAFMGEKIAPDDTTEYMVPQLTPTAGGFDAGSVADYFGLPTSVPNISVNALFFRAYALIWNEWFRDQNLQDPIAVPVGPGPDLETFYPLLKRGKRHDYFTSCLPWPQKGPGVELPLTGNAPVRGLLVQDNIAATSPAGTTYWDAVGSKVDVPRWDSTYMFVEAPANGVASGTNLPKVFADLSSVGATTINSLREAFQLQKLLERDARGGTRYVEILKSHFGVTSPDFRLQRPEFLGGTSVPIMLTPVAQTSGTPGTGGYTPTPQGNLAAYATGGIRNDGFTKSFVEHSIVIGLCMVRADLTYQNGVPKMFSRKTKYDYYWPALSHLGEQLVSNREIFAQGTADDDLPFGYQERWAEYRYYPSKITGKLRSNDPQSLDVWHLSQEFATLPTLSASFIEENPPIDRVIAVTDEPQFVMDCFIKAKTVRPMPVYSVPGYIDHF